MKLTFLGTSAANAFPEAFCRCKNCEDARKLGGKSLRKRSSLLINDDLLVDLGPDIMTSSQIHSISLTNVQYCIQTHFHSDHMDLSHILSRSPEYGVIGAPCLNFYASEETIQKAAKTFERDLSEGNLMSAETQDFLNLKLHSISPLTPFEFGSYRIIAFKANHAPNEGALLYAIESENKCIFYGTDTATFFESTWHAFDQFGLKFDIVILDHTYGLNQSGSDHLNIHQFIGHIKRMKNEGLFSSNSQAFATHIAHEGNPTHPEMAAYAEQQGYEIAYDGLIVDI